MFLKYSTNTVIEKTVHAVKVFHFEGIKNRKKMQKYTYLKGLH